MSFGQVMYLGEHKATDTGTKFLYRTEVAAPREPLQTGSDADGQIFQ